MTLPPPLQGQGRDRLLEAFARIERFGQRLGRQHADQIHCCSGCDGCCRHVLSPRGVEAAYLLEGARGMGGEAVSLVWKALENPTGSCPLLQGSLCLAYDHRPAVCRTHGLPLLRREAGVAMLHHCPENFRDLDPRELPPALILDEGRLSLVMDAVDALYCRETGWAGGRVDTVSLLRAGLLI